MKRYIPQAHVKRKDELWTYQIRFNRFSEQKYSMTQLWSCKVQAAIHRNKNVPYFFISFNRNHVLAGKGKD